jgi:phosphatidylglycerophosphate synthase
MSTSALLFATAEDEGRGPAAAQPLADGTLVGRLLRQLGGLGVRSVWVVTRPRWAPLLDELSHGLETEVRVVASADAGEDLRRAADIARRAQETLLVGHADALIHGEALAGLLSDPRLATAVLVSSSPPRAGSAFPIRSAHGRVIAAASSHHRVTGPTGYSLGFMRIDARDRPALADTALALADLVHADVRDDAVALLLVGLVRSGGRVGESDLRGFFYARPQSRAALRGAEDEMATLDEDRIALAAAVKGSDGFFTTFFVSPYSRYIARFAARRGLTPNAMTTVSMAVGAGAAAAFAVGSRLGLVVGAVLLQAAFTLDCVDGQLARYTHTFSNVGAWLDSVFDRGKEYLVYAGLAIGSRRSSGDDVWTLAAVALTLQTVRHMIDFSFYAARHEAIATVPRVPLDDVADPPPPADAGRSRSGAELAVSGVEPRGGTVLTAPPVAPAPAALPAKLGSARRAVAGVDRLNRRPAALWAKRIIVLPIGERFALISATAALGTPRLTFIVLLAWGALATLYAVPGRILRSVAR